MNYFYDHNEYCTEREIRSRSSFNGYSLAGLALVPVARDYQEFVWQNYSYIEIFQYRYFLISGITEKDAIAFKLRGVSLLKLNDEADVYSLIPENELIGKDYSIKRFHNISSDMI